MNATAPLPEIRHYLDGLSAEFRAERKFPELLEIETVKDIANDDSKRLGSAADLIVNAEREDVRAAALMEGVLKDGRVEDSEIPALLEALALIKASARKDHQAAELVSA